MSKESRKSQLVSGMGLGLQILSELMRQAQELGVSEEEIHVLATPDGVPHMKKFVEGLKSPAPEIPKPVYLHQLYVGEEVTLDSTDGLKTIARAKEVFLRGINSDFMNWDLDTPAQPTKTTKVSVHEMFEQDGTLAEIYGSLGHPLDRLCLTQHQIIDFCVKHKNRLRQKGFTFFLFKVRAHYFVASVYVNTVADRSAHVYRFSYDDVWYAKCRPQFVLPQLDA